MSARAAFRPITLALAMGLSSIALPVHAETTDREGRIVFVKERIRSSGRLGHDRIWTVDADGSNPVP